MNEKIISVLRSTRQMLQVGVEPLDWTVRMLNNKHGYPPLWVRQKVGGLNDFEGSGAEYMAYLKLLCNLEPGDNLLDVGCGCGLMCLPINENGTLPEYIKPGSYCGMDTDKRLIDWCDKNIELSNGFFIHIDGRGSIPGLKETVDVILCKSLFTHLFPSEIIDYVAEIKRLLKPGGRCLSTWFLLDKVEKMESRYEFKGWDGKCHFSTERKTKPRLAIGYRLDWILDVLDMANLTYELYRGNWRGDNMGLSFQDIIIIRRGNDCKD